MWGFPDRGFKVILTMLLLAAAAGRAVADNFDLELTAIVTAPSYDEDGSFDVGPAPLSGSAVANSNGTQASVQVSGSPYSLGNYYQHIHDFVPTGGTAYSSAFDTGSGDVNREAYEPSGPFPQELILGITVSASWDEGGHTNCGRGGWWLFEWVNDDGQEEIFWVALQGGEVYVDRPGIANDEHYFLDPDAGGFTENMLLLDAGIDICDEGDILFS